MGYPLQSWIELLGVLEVGEIQVLADRTTIHNWEVIYKTLPKAVIIEITIDLHPSAPNQKMRNTNIDILKNQELGSESDIFEISVDESLL
jgi:hypothetical protein